MLDIRFIREHPDLVRAGAQKKKMAFDLDELLRLDEQRRTLTQKGDALRAQSNRASKQIAQLKGEEKQEAIKEMREVSAAIKALEGEQREVEEQYNDLMLLVPNPPASDVPDGETDEDNVEIRRWGELPRFDFEPKDHVRLGEALDLIDIPRGVKLGGTRSYFLKNEAVLLEWAVCRFTLDHLIAKGFVPMTAPQLVKDFAMVGTAWFPMGADQAYRIERDELNLIGTAEVPVTAYHYDEILSEDELPKHYAGFSTCFRREAGTYGKDTRGLYRIHQFQKVEQVVICRNDEETSIREHEFILQNAEEIVQALQLPYRVVNVCGGDLGQAQIQKYDIETWMPGRNAYGETHSCSRFHDFQARRLKLRYRDREGQVHFAHTLNNTAIASPRILIPILENYQQADGSILVPEALRPYMGGMERIERR
ncbi:MAG: serine--tRNA ligase [Candidatus Latescibacteria bacterium]|nr:serine--tRNA ligase [Candidatus Latescibacterota bacterium]